MCLGLIWGVPGRYLGGSLELRGYLRGCWGYSAWVVFGGCVCDTSGGIGGVAVGVSLVYLGV